MRSGVCVLLVVALSVLAASCRKKTLEEKMAVHVNGVGVPEKRVSMIFDAYMARMPRSLMFARIPDEIKAQLRAQIVEQLIDQELLYQEAQRRGVVVPDSLVRRSMTMTQSFYRSEGQFDDRLSEMGVTRENVADDHRRALIVDRYLDAQIGQIPVSDQDLAEYYQAHQDQFVWTDAVHTRHILIRVAPAAPLEGRVQAFEQARDLLARLRAGEDFSALAKAHSQDEQSAARGGDLGWVEQGTLALQYEDAAAALKPGQISEVVKTPYGYHIIQLLDRRKGGDVKSLDEVRDRVRDLVARQRREEQTQQIVQEIRRHATLKYEGA